MRIAWVTPFDRKSAIGRYSKYAAEEIAKFHQVDIFTPEYKEYHKTKLDIYVLEENTDRLLQYDICVYNIGDNSIYHALIWEAAQQVPGIIISHDMSLHNFVRGYWIAHRCQPDKYIELIQEKFGEEEAEYLLEAAGTAGTWNEVDFQKYNLSDVVCENALAVVVHSNYHRRIMEQFYSGILSVIPLLDMNELDSAPDDLEFDGYNRDKINILTVGNVNPNKRIHSIIRVIGENEVIKKHIHYTVIGSLAQREYAEELEWLIERYELQDNVKLLGFVEHETLACYYRDADIIANLRCPAIEGASASLNEQMLLGKAVIVSNTGMYADIPDDCVIKISAEAEKEDLEKELLRLAKDKDQLEKIGKNAKRFAKKEFSREHYREAFLEVLEQVRFLKPMHELIRKVNYRLNLMGSLIDTEIIDNVVNEIDRIFASDSEAKE